jgi:hypothetical protein
MLIELPATRMVTSPRSQVPLKHTLGSIGIKQTLQKKPNLIGFGVKNNIRRRRVQRTRLFNLNFLENFDIIFIEK